jgi:hypothetical protein
MTKRSKRAHGRHIGALLRCGVHPDRSVCRMRGAAWAAAGVETRAGRPLVVTYRTPRAERSEKAQGCRSHRRTHAAGRACAPHRGTTPVVSCFDGVMHAARLSRARSSPSGFASSPSLRAACLRMARFLTNPPPRFSRGGSFVGRGRQRSHLCSHCSSWHAASPVRPSLAVRLDRY